MTERMDGDMSMCLDDGCPSACKCLRYLSVPAKHQSYADQGRVPGEEKCQSFIPLQEASR